MNTSMFHVIQSEPLREGEISVSSQMVFEKFVSFMNAKIKQFYSLDKLKKRENCKIQS